ncbi:MAG TPA: hypothetical protein VEC12_03930, partial [Bacteroidia bacterium]|nr:hypothetical protein [Bacteroidia bacterium]
VFTSCKKEKPEMGHTQPPPAYYNCRVNIIGLTDFDGAYINSYFNPIKLIVTDTTGDTVYTDYYNKNKTDITFPLLAGKYIISVVDTVEIYAPYVIKHKVHPPRGGEPNMYQISLTKCPPYEINVEHITDTVMNRNGRLEKAIFMRLTSTKTSGRSYFFANYFDSPLSYPIHHPSIISGTFKYIDDGEGEFWHPILSADHEYINKGDTFYYAFAEASGGWYHHSKTEIYRDSLYYNATSKNIRNYKFIN